MTAVTDWLPPGWVTGSDPGEPLYYTVQNIYGFWQQYHDRGYITKDNKLAAAARDQDRDDISDIEAVQRNVALLRDAWNTPATIWQLCAKLIGTEFRVDPFWNPQSEGLPNLAVKLVGPADLDTIDDPNDGLAVDADGFPRYWRGDLPQGQAAAAVNGPHSFTRKWLMLCQRYGAEEFCAAFVTERGDGWFTDIGLTADLVVRLGRVPCKLPPGIPTKTGKSSPMQSSAALIWLPESLRESLPEYTRDALRGETLAVPLWRRKKLGLQYAYVQPAAIDMRPREDGGSIIDFGLAD